jgi:bacterioferritin-associated ferredoxin
MIIRRWHALADDERPYLGHFRRPVLPALSAIDSFKGSPVLRRRAADKRVNTEVLTFWPSMNAIQRFVGPDSECAVVENQAKAVLRSFARQVQHFELMLEVRTIRRQTRSEERRSNAQKGKRDG